MRKPADRRALVLPHAAGARRDQDERDGGAVAVIVAIVWAVLAARRD